MCFNFCLTRCRTTYNVRLHGISSAAPATRQLCLVGGRLPKHILFGEPSQFKNAGFLSCHNQLRVVKVFDKQPSCCKHVTPELVQQHKGRVP